MRRHCSRVICATVFAGCTLQERESTSTNAPPPAQLATVATLLSADSTPYEADPFGATVTPWGSALLLNSQEQTVGVFDSSGRASFVAGGKGEGPGQLSSLGTAFFLHPDTLALFDRNRKAVYLRANGRLPDAMLDFSTWPRGGDGRFQLVGRFADGRWIVAHGVSPVDESEGARVIADSTYLLAGRPGDVPRRLFLLPPQRRVLLVQGNSTYRFSVPDVRTAASICDSGVVVVDSSGVTLVDGAGRTRRHVPTTATTSLSQRMRAALLDGAVRDLPNGPFDDDARALLSRELNAIDRTLPHVVIGSSGEVWIAQDSPGGGRSRYRRIDDAAEADAAFETRGHVVAIGGHRVLTVAFDTSTDLPSFRLSRLQALPPASPVRMGSCQPMFSW